MGTQADKDRADYGYCTPKPLPDMLVACKTAKEAATSAMVTLATVEYSDNRKFIQDARNDAIRKLREALAALGAS